jgi:hypothetical protein
MRELTYDPLFLPMLVLERRDLETGLPDDTYAQVSLALQAGSGGTGRSVQRHIGFDRSACLKLGLGLLHGRRWGPRNFHNPQICGPPFRLRCENSKRRYALTHYFAIWWINLHPNPSLRRHLLH